MFDKPASVFLQAEPNAIEPYVETEPVLPPESISEAIVESTSQPVDPIVSAPADLNGVEALEITETSTNDTVAEIPQETPTEEGADTR